MRDGAEEMVYLDCLEWGQARPRTRCCYTGIPDRFDTSLTRITQYHIDDCTPDISYIPDYPESVIRSGVLKVVGHLNRSPLGDSLVYFASASSRASDVKTEVRDVHNQHPSA